jgi:hypothetical protein
MPHDNDLTACQRNRVNIPRFALAAELDIVRRPMKTRTLPALVLACGAVACSGQPSAHDSVLERTHSACSGFAIPLPEGATPPVLVSTVKPEPGPHAPYPSATSCLEVQIEPDGSVTYIRTLSTTNAAFADVVRRAVIRWRYQPAALSGKAIPVRMAVSAAFEHH